MERVEGRFMGSPIDITPTDAILLALRVTAGEVAYCDEQIARLEEDELFENPTERKWVQLPSGRIEEVEVSMSTEQMNRWVQWRQQAIDNMAKYAKQASDMKIDERQIALAEKTAHQIVSVISAVLLDLGHDPKDIHTREVVRRHLMQGTAIDSTATSVREMAS